MLNNSPIMVGDIFISFNIMPSTKKRIRDIERLLKRDTLSAESKENLQRELNSLKSANDRNKLREKEKVLSKKYHMVKFFERKKLTRSVRAVDNKLKEDPNDKALNKERKRLLKDLAYVLYYPRHLEYVSLLVSKDENEEEINGSKREAARKLALDAWQRDKDVSIFVNSFTVTISYAYVSMGETELSTLYM